MVHAARNCELVDGLEVVSDVVWGQDELTQRQNDPDKGSEGLA
jgi:hypothetical protein